MMMKHMTSEFFVDSLERYLTPDYGSFEDARPNLIELIRPYEDEAWRRHHNLPHLGEMAEHLLPVVHQLNDPAAVFGSVLGHDSNYEPRLWKKKGANEELSRLRSEYFIQPHYTPQRIRKIGHYIMATVEHPNDIDDLDLAEFLDADMSVIGAPEGRYLEYADAIMEEYVTYGGLPKRAFLEGRIKFLRNFDAKQRIFITERAQDLYEAQAHHNLGAEALKRELELG